MEALFNEFLRDEQGQDLTEYTLLIVFVMLAIIGLATGYHNSIGGVASSTNAVLAAGNAAIANGTPTF
jgi:Flp pilus assembly pilin Flp